MVVSLTLLTCKREDVVDPINYSSEYGKGVYILTKKGVTYFDNTSEGNEKVIKENIYNAVNSESLNNVRSLFIKGDDLFIVTKNSLYWVDIETFANRMRIDGFLNAQNCKRVNYDRMYVSDQGDSKIRIVDLSSKDIIGSVETGENTNPGFILTTNTSYFRAFVMNEGGNLSNDYDSTLVTIDYQDSLVLMNEFSGNIIVGKNPVSALINNLIIVLCKGIYDENNPIDNTSSSVYVVHPNNLNVWSIIPLNNIYNANNLTRNSDYTKYFITSHDGVYWLDVANYTPNLVTNKKNPSVLCSDLEEYADTDSTFSYYDILYMNNKNDMGVKYVYKYNIQLNQFVDSFAVNDQVVDIQVYK